MKSAVSATSKATNTAEGCRIAATSRIIVLQATPTSNGVMEVKKTDMRRSRTSSGTSLPGSVSQFSDRYLGIVQ